MQSSDSNRLPFTAAVREFLRLESLGGVLVLAAAVLALLTANSAWSDYYEALLETEAAVRIGSLLIEKPLLLWINDGLMAVFFFLIGLELKREFLEGELSSPEKLTLPLIGAAGGIAVPALIYALLNGSDATAMDGWAIPVATDIAFVLALLGAFGSRVPLALKVFVLTLAIIDDLAGIVRLPREISGMQVLGVAFACGIGFTMSLFIAGLALEHGSGEYFNKARLGVLLGSAIAALFGGLVLHMSLARRGAK